MNFQKLPKNNFGLSNIIQVVVLLMLMLEGRALCQSCGAVPNTTQKAGEFLAGPLAMMSGRAAVVAYHKNCIFMVPESAGMLRPGSDFQSKYFDISNLRSPKEHNIKITANSTIAAHGYLYIGDAVIFRNENRIVVNNNVPSVLGANWNTGPVWASTALGTWPVVSNLNWVQYGTRSGSNKAEVYKRGKLVGSTQTRIGGIHIVMGNRLYVTADQSFGGRGIEIYDLTPSFNSFGTAPRLIASLNSKVGGYIPVLYGDGDRLAVVTAQGFVAPTDGDTNPRIQIIEVADEKNIRISKEFRIDKGVHKNSEPRYIQFQDNLMFTERFQIDMNTFALNAILQPEEENVSVSEFALPVGNLIISGGQENSFAGQRQGTSIWARQADPDNKGPKVGYHIPRPNATNYPVAAPISILIHETLRSETIQLGSSLRVRSVESNGSLGGDIASDFAFSYDDILTITPMNNLANNTTYQVDVVGGGIKDAVGNGIIGYSFRFSTGENVIEQESNNPPVNPPQPRTPSVTNTRVPRPTGKPTVIVVPTAVPVRTPKPVKTVSVPLPTLMPTVTSETSTPVQVRNTPTPRPKKTTGGLPTKKPTIVVPTRVTPTIRPKISKIKVRALGSQGDEVLKLLIADKEVASWKMAPKKWKDFIYVLKEPLVENLKVEFSNDIGAERSIKVDYLSINGNKRQSEDMSKNTAAWNYEKESCGEEGIAKTEWMECNGFIDFSSSASEGVKSAIKVKRSDISFSLNSNGDRVSIVVKYPKLTGCSVKISASNVMKYSSSSPAPSLLQAAKKAFPIAELKQNPSDSETAVELINKSRIDEDLGGLTMSLFAKYECDQGEAIQHKVVSIYLVSGKRGLRYDGLNKVNSVDEWLKQINK
jgi:hypothetical protein